MAPRTDFDSQIFGVALARLRTDAHLSQRALSKWSGVSNTAISDLEAGTAPPPHPTALQKIARGLATNGSGVVDEDRAESTYLALMRAAGYVPDERAEQSDDALLRRLIERRIGTDNAPLAEALLDKIRDPPAVDQQAVLSVVEALLRTLPPHTAR